MTLGAGSGLSSVENRMFSSMSGLKLSNSHRIIVGVDFGTTYTGISYIDSNTSKTDTESVQDVGTWPGPGKNTDSVLKTPSRIAYNTENTGITTNQFGYQVTPKMKSYSWTKLLLDQSSRATEFDDPSLKRTEGGGMLTLPGGKTAEEVVADYLREVYKCFVDEISRRISVEVVRVTPMEFWFTVPAIWSDRAKSATLSAARSAGFAGRNTDSIQLIPEPEAAGVASLKSLAEGKSASKVSPGEGILICDCGGGTVDITSYKIIQVTPKLEFEELVEGTGGKCGSTYIDRAFRRWMSSKFGRLFDSLKFEKTGPGSRFMKEFESHKRDFGYSPDLEKVEDVNLVIPGATDSAYYDTDESVVKLDGHTMLTFFDPVVTMILALLDQQINAIAQRHPRDIVKRVILVGGLGDSPYLNHRIREWCQRLDMSVLCPSDPQAAIARGAALRGLECVVPIKRRSRRHYGLQVGMPFRQGIDPERNSYICSWSKQKVCPERIEWFIGKGDVFDDRTKIVREYWMSYYESSDLQQSWPLYSCSSDVAPDFIDDADVERVAMLDHNIDSAELQKCESMRLGGERVWRVSYQREIYVGNREGTLSFDVVRDGKSWGKTEVVYDGKASR